VKIIREGSRLQIDDQLEDRRALDREADDVGYPENRDDDGPKLEGI
jgi:hypothetical protein